jgi:hypothetical protein
VKNEAPYIAEWIEYHLLVGVEKFWLADNDSDDNLTAVLDPYIRLGIVNLTSWPGIGQQVPFYQFALDPLRSSSYWVAVMDIDEFLVPVAGRSVPAILHNFEGSPGITVN